MKLRIFILKHDESQLKLMIEERSLKAEALEAQGNHRKQNKCFDSAQHDNF